MSSPLSSANRFAPATAQGGGLASAAVKVEIIQPADYVDRRAEPRTDCNDRGALLLMADNSVVPCRIMDQSPSGARVAFETIGNIPAEIWLIDLDTHMARRGSSAWSTPNRMGLKFNFVQTLVVGQPRPVKVPQEVYDAWLRLTGNGPSEETKPDDAGDDDVLYLD